MKHFDLFSGYGGFSIAGERNGIETIGFSEIDKYANAVLKYHFSNIKNYGEITKIKWSEVSDFDLLTGGSPCQDFSIAGKRKGIIGERSGLVWEFIRCLEEKKPKYFIWENVKGVMSSRRGFDFANIITAFSEAGYSLWWQILNAKDFSVPQNRERIFVCGFREGSPREVFFERGNDKLFIKKNASQSSCLKSPLRAKGDKGLIEITKNQSQGYRVYNPEGIATNQASNAGGVGAKTGLYAIPVLTPDRLNKRQNGRRMKTDGEPSFTLNTQDKHGIFNGSRIRRLTPVECERLMGLPDNWTKYGDFNGEIKEISDTQRYKLCGNGVVVNVVEQIIKELFLC